jgi:uncharacterized membrane protein
MTDLDDDEWENDENWHAGWLGIYYAPRDPRVWVPKRPPRFGWTVNFARRVSWVWLVGVVTVPVAIIAIANWFGANIH